jgi:hypothetical protein
MSALKFFIAGERSIQTPGANLPFDLASLAIRVSDKDQ